MKGVREISKQSLLNRKNWTLYALSTKQNELFNDNNHKLLRLQKRFLQESGKIVEIFRRHEMIKMCQAPSVFPET